MRRVTYGLKIIFEYDITYKHSIDFTVTSATDNANS